MSNENSNNNNHPHKEYFEEYNIHLMVEHKIKPEMNKILRLIDQKFKVETLKVIRKKDDLPDLFEKNQV